MTDVSSARFSASNLTTAWILVAIGVAVAVAGFFLGWGKQFTWFDEILHLYNPFAIMLLLTMLLYGDALMGAGKHATAFVLTVMLVGLGLGGFWEILEWTYDQLFTQGSAIKGKTDTIIDLTLDAIGALIAGGVALKMARE